MPTLHLTKHHGLGNDFLVLLDPPAPPDAALARALCDRHGGVGADGLLVGTTGGGALGFQLFNADGSEAEMSGNGIRCLVQAALDAGAVHGPDVLVQTPAGNRLCTAGPEEAAGRRHVRVDMGPAAVEEVGEGSARISMGNPHHVLLVTSLDAVESTEPDRNVEFVVPGPEPGAITMRVVERGVGETLACGTGACAAAVAARAWGLVGERVVVHQRGGDAVVELGDVNVFLSGPAQRVARIEVDTETVLGAVATATRAGAAT